MVIKINLSRTFLVTAETLNVFSVYEDLMLEDFSLNFIKFNDNS